MSVRTDAILLRVFVGEEDRHNGRPLYEEIVAQALQSRLAGATVLRGPEGFGSSGHARSELYVDAGPRLPVVVEIVDSEAQIDRFLPLVNDMIGSGLVTLEKVRAIRYPRRDPAASTGEGREEPVPRG